MTRSGAAVRRRSPGRVFAEMHYALRTEGDSPPRRAAAVALGTFLGCLPVYGAHLLLCVAFARLFGLSRITTYLAAHVNNPLTAPFLLYVELVVGHLVRSGRLPPFTLAHLSRSSLAGIGVELLIGSVTVGLLLAVVFGAATWMIAMRRTLGLTAALRDEASRPYLDAGISHWEFVRGKLRFDPFYQGLLRHGVLPRRGRLLDLGCGRGILPSLLIAAETLWREDRWAANAASMSSTETTKAGAQWQPPPLGLELVGVDARRKHVEVARRALGPRATIHLGDVLGPHVEPADVIVLADVLHYLSAERQEQLLDRAARALRPGGRLLLRECDASAGARFVMTRVQERICALFRGEWRQRFHYRDEKAWSALLEAQGLTTESRPMWGGTPYSNVLIEARKSSAAAGARPPSSSENSARRGASGSTR